MGIGAKIGRSIAWGQDKWWRRDKFKPVLQTLEYLVALDEGEREDTARIGNNGDRPHVCQQVESELPQIIAKVGKSKRELLDIVSSQMERVREAEAGWEHARQVLTYAWISGELDCIGFGRDGDPRDQSGYPEDKAVQKNIDFKLYASNHCIDDHNRLVTRWGEIVYSDLYCLTAQVEKLLPVLLQRVRERPGLRSSAEVSSIGAGAARAVANGSHGIVSTSDIHDAITTVNHYAEVRSMKPPNIKEIAKPVRRLLRRKGRDTTDNQIQRLAGEERHKLRRRQPGPRVTAAFYLSRIRKCRNLVSKAGRVHRPQARLGATCGD